MGSITTMRKRWRATFSLRSLVLLTTAVCLYFAGWQVTVTRGVKVLAGHLGGGAAVEAKAPFLLAGQLSTISQTTTALQVGTKKSLYLWAFGRMIKLPFITRQVVKTTPRPVLPPPWPPAGGSPSRQIDTPPAYQPIPSTPVDTPPFQRTMPFRLDTATKKKPVWSNNKNLT